MRNMRGKKGRMMCFREWKRKEEGRGSEEGRKKIWDKRKEKDGKMGSKGGREEVGKKENGGKIRG
jgi:hypothetical protein